MGSASPLADRRRRGYGEGVPAPAASLRFLNFTSTVDVTGHEENPPLIKPLVTFFAARVKKTARKQLT